MTGLPDANLTDMEATKEAVADELSCGLPEAKYMANSGLAHILRQPVLRTEIVKQPVVVRSVELLRNGRQYLVRVRSTDGVEAIVAANPERMGQAYPIFLQSIAPVVVGRDARELETLLWEIYRHKSNYKLQGIGLWAGVMAIEKALLELLGQATQRPMADFFGGRLRTEIPVYFASYVRGNRPEEEIANLHQMVGSSGVEAIKFRIGGRMNCNADSLPGRTEALIPLVRQAFGDAMTLFADANSSYDAAEAIRIGRIMEEHGYGFLEEPCEFDDLWATKEVADALALPVGGGEQEFSLHRWRWVIENRGVDIVQPDLNYGGGFIRAVQVARMAAAAGMPVVPHISGGGLSYVDVLHYASMVPNLGPFVEFKRYDQIPIECRTSRLGVERGIVQCPVGPGFGVKIDPGFVRKCRVVTA